MKFSAPFRRTMLVVCGLGLVAGGPARAQFFFPFFDNRPSRPPNAEIRRHPARHERATAEAQAKNRLHRPKLREAEEKRHKGNKVVALAKAEAPAAAVVEGPPPPYEPQLLRLSEIMGALSYLQTICAGQTSTLAAAKSPAEDPLWRERMQDLMAAEAAGPTQREKLAGAFNRGLRGYEFSYRACTPNAMLARSRFLDEGAQLAHEISTQYRAN
jgi:uncharacterized protein (TIGR02301 family)